MLFAPFALFPFSKTIWLAFDLMLRPVTPEELQWHRAAACSPRSAYFAASVASRARALAAQSIRWGGARSRNWR